MIRFRILGSGDLELSENFEFQFNFNNSLFAFDNMKVNRTTEFQIPATPNNNIKLQFSNDIANNGGYIRTAKAAQLFYDGGKIDGKLLIGKFSGGNYSAIFIYGELVQLKTIKDFGAISNYCSFADTVTMSDSNITSAYNASGILAYNFRLYKYRSNVADGVKLTDNVNMLPTAKLSYLLSTAATAVGATVDFTGLNGYDSIGLILSEMKASPTAEAVNIAGTPNDDLSLTGGTSYFSVGSRTFKYKPWTALFWKNKEVIVFVAKKDLSFKFETEQALYGVVSGDGRTFLSPSSDPIFFGYITAGLEIKLKKGDYFTIVNRNDYFFANPIDDFGNSVDVDFNVWAGNYEAVDVDEVYPLQQNLPELTFTDLLKVYANLYHCGIDYDSATNTFSFYNFGFDKANATDISDVIIEIKSVDRTFLDYAQKNTVDFKSEDYVKSPYQFIYQIQNEGLSEEKKLFTIPFNDGILSTNNDIFVDDFKSATPYEKTGKEISIAVASKDSGQEYLKHVSQLEKNFSVPNVLKGIIENSTTVEMRLKMSEADFLRITNKTVYKYRGRFFVPISGNQSGNVADLSMIIV